VKRPAKLKLNPTTIRQLTPPRILDPKQLPQVAGGSYWDCASHHVATSCVVD
jgi:hypothetical protein